MATSVFFNASPACDGFPFRPGGYLPPLTFDSRYRATASTSSSLIAGFGIAGRAGFTLTGFRMNPFSFATSPLYFGTTSFSGGPTTLAVESVADRADGVEHLLPLFQYRRVRARRLLPGLPFLGDLLGRQRPDGGGQPLVGVAGGRLVAQDHGEEHQDEQGRNAVARPAFLFPGEKVEQSEYGQCQDRDGRRHDEHLRGQSRDGECDQVQHDERRDRQRPGQGEGRPGGPDARLVIGAPARLSRLRPAEEPQGDSAGKPEGQREEQEEFHEGVPGEDENEVASNQGELGRVYEGPQQQERQEGGG